jgi:hypothetical protein
MLDVDEEEMIAGAIKGKSKSQKVDYEREEQVSRRRIGRMAKVMVVNYQSVLTSS